MVGSSETAPARPEQLRRVPKRYEVATVAAIDVFGIIFTVVAAVVLVATERAASGWWALVGIAAFLGVVSTVVLVRLSFQRRKFVTDAQNLIARLQG